MRPPRETLTPMTAVDIAFIVIILVSTVISLFRGFVREALSLVTWVVAVWVGIVFADMVAPLFAEWVSRPEVRQVLGFALLFIIVLIVGGLFNHLVSIAVEKSGLSGTDRSLGMVFGMARGVALVTAIVMLGGLATGPSGTGWASWEQSRLVPYFQPLASWMQGFFEEQTGGELDELGV